MDFIVLLWIHNCYNLSINRKNEKKIMGETQAVIDMLYENAKNLLNKNIRKKQEFLIES